MNIFVLRVLFTDRIEQKEKSLFVLACNLFVYIPGQWSRNCTCNVTWYLLLEKSNTLLQNLFENNNTLSEDKIKKIFAWIS